MTTSIPAEILAALRAAVGADWDASSATEITREPLFTAFVSRWCETRVFFLGDAEERALTRDHIVFDDAELERLAIPARWTPAFDAPPAFEAAIDALPLDVDSAITGGAPLRLDVRFHTLSNRVPLGPVDPPAAFFEGAPVAVTRYGVHGVTLDELAPSTPRADAPADAGALDGLTEQGAHAAIKSVNRVDWRSRVHATQTRVLGGPTTRVVTPDATYWVLDATGAVHTDGG